MDISMLMAMLFFPAIGAMVGLNAARKRGFSVAGGVIGGIFLGILSPLLYLAQGTRKRCANCAEWIEPAALVCPHCRQPVDAAQAAAPAPARAVQQQPTRLRPPAPRRAKVELKCPACGAELLIEE